MISTYKQTISSPNGLVYARPRGVLPLRPSPLIALIELELRGKKKRACQPLRNAAIGTRIKGLRSIGDLRGQVNDPKSGFGFELTTSSKVAAEPTMTSSSGTVVIFSIRPRRMICFLFRKGRREV